MPEQINWTPKTKESGKSAQDLLVCEMKNELPLELLGASPFTATSQGLTPATFSAALISEMRPVLGMPNPLHRGHTQGLGQVSGVPVRRWLGISGAQQPQQAGSRQGPLWL